MPLATSAAAAFVLALALLPRTDVQDPSLGASLSLAPQRVQSASLRRELAHAPPGTQFMLPRCPVRARDMSQDAAAGVYDLSPGERPAMIFQNEDGSTMLWLLEEDDLSFLFGRMDRWG